MSMLGHHQFGVATPQTVQALFQVFMTFGFDELEGNHFAKLI